MLQIPPLKESAKTNTLSSKDCDKVKLKQWEKEAQKVSWNISRDSSLLISIAKDLAAQFLPQELRQQISQINKTGGLTHLHIKGLPQDDYLPKSPVDGNLPVGKRSFVSEIILLGIISEALGAEVFAYQEEKNGDLVQNIAPIKGLEKTQSNASIGKFGWHSDDVPFKRPYRAEGIALYCLRNQSRTLTYFADIDDIIKALHPMDLKVLREPRFRVRTPESFRLYGGKMVYSEPRAIITDGEAGAEIVLATYNILPVDDDDDEALDALYALNLALRTPVAKSFLLQQGDLLILSNVRGVHACGPIVGGDYWLQLCYFRRDLTDLRQVTNSSDDCRVFSSEQLLLLSCSVIDKVDESKLSDKQNQSKEKEEVQVSLKQVHDLVTGRIDAILFADFLDVKVKDMANLLDVSTTGLRKNPTSDKLRPILNRLYIVIDKLLHIFDCSVSEVKLWLNAPNSYLEYKTPIDCIFVTNNLEEVEELVDAMEDGGLL